MKNKSFESKILTLFWYSSDCLEGGLIRLKEFYYILKIKKISTSGA